ncbi:hypothetical protein Vadar_000465 [Vaccinium darrowii]|uniref:Uncharacterized protein n=1 Tax=Vaccinium darrowii TaxID=229202 RepID=A0ACB7YCA5_9ERIC|nr:hypothetical protein Vadar_000465 [Vaccinium darrowii]
MALCNSKLPTHFRPVLFPNFLRFAIFLFLLFPFANSISFNLSNFQTNDKYITYQGDALASDGVVQLTKNQEDSSLTSSAGRASYAYPIYLWDNITGNLTDFDTNFTVNGSSTNVQDVGDGLTFYLSAYNAAIPINSSGGFLGLFENSTALNHTNNQIVAVEFDSHQNSWDPSEYHVK